MRKVEVRYYMNKTITPQISIIIPLYNAEKTIGRCLDSIYTQTFSSYEVIIVDDGSTDNSAELAKFHPVGRSIASCRVISQNNKGAAAARNLGLSMARGKYVTFIDNDDWIDSDFLDTLFNAAEHNDADIVISGYRRPDSDNKIVNEVKIRPNTEWSAYSVGAAWGKLYLRSFIEANNLKFYISDLNEDLPFTLGALLKSNRAITLPYCGYNWFFNPTSTSNTTQHESNRPLFEQALNELEHTVRSSITDFSPIVTYFFVRHIVWYLFWTCGLDSPKAIESNIDNYTRWLDSHIPNWRQVVCKVPYHPSGEAASTKIIVAVFISWPSLFKRILLGYRFVQSFSK